MTGLDLLTRHVRRSNEDDVRFADWTLNVARCLYRLRTRTLGSKRAAVEWLTCARPDLRLPLQEAISGVAGDAAAARRCRGCFSTFVAEACAVAAEISAAE